MDTAFSKILADGRTAYVTPLITVFGAVSYEAVDGDGQRIAGGWLENAAKRGVAEEDMPVGCTHLIPAAPKPLWFTPEEVEQLTALGAAAKAAFDVSAEGRQLDTWRREQAEQTKASAARAAVLHSPEGEALVAQRARLAAAAEAVLDADAEQRDRAHEDEGGDPGVYYRGQQPRNEAAYGQACDALAAFDAEHPQIIAALNEQEAADVRRRLEFD
ncbi:hypothetical protein [Streptomyces sp. S1D4-20]|uniref:hypothetical protein n=1 Tax=Streptomyces sp. S1D4-20 TaxID=2594462 RepID=UPI0011649364|nr:hypothetical protein [Streptomyces sp. S1D4-20]QDN54019.1 hypothetical protein FNV67_00080 [Streptomyces sp. S1D4-20]